MLSNNICDKHGSVKPFQLKNSFFLAFNSCQHRDKCNKILLIPKNMGHLLLHPFKFLFQPFSFIPQIIIEKPFVVPDSIRTECCKTQTLTYEVVTSATLPIIVKNQVLKSAFIISRLSPFTTKISMLTSVIRYFLSVVSLRHSINQICH